MSKADHVLQTATATEVAKAAGRSIRWVQQAATDGRFKRSSHGRYDLLSVITDLAREADEKAAEPPRSEARDRIDQVRAQEAEMRLAEKKRALIPQEEALHAMSLLCGAVVSELSGLPRRCTRDIDIQKVIEAEVTASRTRIADEMGKLAGFIK